ncbi:MAG TPA: hypothetical protein VFR70_00915 [Flavobacterium sp.]|nr:hypothetical protein [Flavobacterium sp.]
MAFNSAYSQAISSNTINIDPRIKEVFADQLQALVLNVPYRLHDLNDILANRVKIENIPYEKNEKFDKLSSVGLFNNYNQDLVRDAAIDEKDFNPLKYNFRFHAKYKLIYRIDNTDKAIVIYPQQQPDFKN